MLGLLLSYSCRIFLVLACAPWSLTWQVRFAWGCICSPTHLVIILRHDLSEAIALHSSCIFIARSLLKRTIGMTHDKHDVVISNRPSLSGCERGLRPPACYKTIEELLTGVFHYGLVNTRHELWLRAHRVLALYRFAQGHSSHSFLLSATAIAQGRIPNHRKPLKSADNTEFKLIDGTSRR